TPARLQAERGIERDIAMRRVVGEETVGNQDAIITRAAAVPEALIQPDPMIAAGIEVVGEIVGVQAGKSEARCEAVQTARLLLPDLQRVERDVRLVATVRSVEV